MRKLRPLCMTLVLGLMLASAPAFAQVVHHVSVGGPDQDAVDHTDANFSLVANQYADGTSTGEWTDRSGRVRAASTSRSTVCSSRATRPG